MPRRLLALLVGAALLAAQIAPVYAVDRLDPQAQGAALLPEFSGDLAAATGWDRYVIEARVDPDARTIAGRLRLEYTNRDSAPLDRVYFRLFPNLPDFGGALAVSAASVAGQRAPLRYEASRFLARVLLPAPLEPGRSTTIDLEFSARTPNNGGERYYAAYNRERSLLALASAYPLVARVRGGAWEIAPPSARGDFVVSDTALYDVTLEAPADWTIVATGVALETRAEGGRQRVRFVSGPQRDFTIALARMQAVSAEVDGTRVTSYYRPESAVGGRVALDAAVSALRAFNRRIGRYPLRELDIVQIDARKFLGVEYPGLIMMDRRLYEGNQTGLEIVVAHEVAHQWWYSLVGNDAQREPWLDEGLASFTQVIYREETAGAAAAERELENFRASYARARDGGRDAPIGRPASTYRGNYVAMVYSKGALFFQALREQIGEPAFDRFLRDYYAAHRYRLATGGDMLASAERACACELDDLYRAWVETATPVQVP